MAAQIDATTHRLLTCIRRFDEAHEWRQQGAQSCAHWLAWRTQSGRAMLPRRWPGRGRDYLTAADDDLDLSLCGWDGTPIDYDAVVDALIAPHVMEIPSVTSQSGSHLSKFPLTSA